MIKRPAPLPALWPARLAFALVLAATTGACTALPEIPPLADTGASPPQLVPLGALLAGIEEPRATDAESSALAARAARLQTRAGLMRGPVLSPQTRSKLAAAIARGDA